MNSGHAVEEDTEGIVNWRRFWCCDWFWKEVLSGNLIGNWKDRKLSFEEALNTHDEDEEEDMFDAIRRRTWVLITWTCGGWIWWYWWRTVELIRHWWFRWRSSELLVDINSKDEVKESSYDQLIIQQLSTLTQCGAQWASRFRRTFCGHCVLCCWLGEKILMIVWEEYHWQRRREEKYRQDWMLLVERDLRRKLDFSWLVLRANNKHITRSSIYCIINIQTPVSSAALSTSKSALASILNREV